MKQGVFLFIVLRVGSVYFLRQKYCYVKPLGIVVASLHRSSQVTLAYVEPG